MGWAPPDPCSGRGARHCREWGGRGGRVMCGMGPAVGREGRLWAGGLRGSGMSHLVVRQDPRPLSHVGPLTTGLPDCRGVSEEPPCGARCLSSPSLSPAGLGLGAASM